MWGEVRGEVVPGTVHVCCAVVVVVFEDFVSEISVGRSTSSLYQRCDWSGLQFVNVVYVHGFLVPGSFGRGPVPAHHPWFVSRSVCQPAPGTCL